MSEAGAFPRTGAAESGAGATRHRGSAARLLVALFLPAACVALGMWVWRSVEATYVLYFLVGCFLGPWLLVGAVPLRRGAGFAFLPPRGERGRALRHAAWLWVACGPAMLAGYLALRPWMGDPHAYLTRLMSLGWVPERLPVYAAAFLAVNPLAEEWWWRGQALPRCVARLGRWPGLLTASIAFAAHHAVVLTALFPAEVLPLRLGSIFLAGLVWAEVARRDRAWVGPYVAHGPGADLAIVIYFARFVR